MLLGQPRGSKSNQPWMFQLLLSALSVWYLLDHKQKAMFPDLDLCCCKYWCRCTCFTQPSYSLTSWSSGFVIWRTLTVDVPNLIQRLAKLVNRLQNLKPKLSRSTLCLAICTYTSTIWYLEIRCIVFEASTWYVLFRFQSRVPNGNSGTTSSVKGPVWPVAGFSGSAGSTGFEGSVGLRGSTVFVGSVKVISPLKSLDPQQKLVLPSRLEEVLKVIMSQSCSFHNKSLLFLVT